MEESPPALKGINGHQTSQGSSTGIMIVFQTALCIDYKITTGKSIDPPIEEVDERDIQSTIA